MLIIRLSRVGRKNRPFFKIVVIDKKRGPKSHRYLEEVGFLDPIKKEKNLKKERIKYWLSVGAQPSDRVYNLLVSEKIILGKKKPLHKKKKTKKKEKGEEKPKEKVKKSKDEKEERREKKS